MGTNLSREEAQAVVGAANAADDLLASESQDFSDVVVRRWLSSDRRLKPAQRLPEKRVRDLERGLRGSLDAEGRMYEEPGRLRHLAETYGAALLKAEADRDSGDSTHAR